MTPKIASADDRALAAPSVNLTLLLAMQAAMQPRKPFLVRADGKAWTFQETDIAAAHLAWLLNQLGVAKGDRVILMAPNSDRAAITLAGLLRGGFQPFLAPTDLPFADGFAITTNTRPTAVIAENVGASGATIEAAARLAAASASVRFVLGFGPGLPKGVMDLSPRLERIRDGAIDVQRADDAVETATLMAALPGGEIAEIALAPLLATCADLGSTASLRSGDRIVSPLPLRDPVGLAAGLFAGLFAGSELALLDAPDRRALAAAFDTQRACHLVWPAAHDHLAAELLKDQPPLRSLIRRCRDLDEEQQNAAPDLRAEHIVNIATRPGGALRVGALRSEASPLRQTRAAS
ncbi:AMP-binding protein [Terrarubrum flagellatum]|uniref:AMP-binding protein n=1 Tax=Terrirubrum flagellatum TaxID=2895980 RepID=UPI0031451C0A